MTIDQLRAFLAVADDGQLTSAARKLGLSQPTLTRQIKSLESELGIDLFVRGSRGMELSAAGHRLLTHARRAVNAAIEGIADLEELTKRPASGTLAIGCLVSVAAYWLPPVLREFCRANPEVSVHLTEGSGHALEDRLASADVDLIIVDGPIRHLDFVAQRLWDDALELLVPRGHRLAARDTAARLEELVDEPFVVMRATHAHERLRETCEAAQRVPRIAVTTDSVETVVRLVGAGVGVALVPALVARGANSSDTQRVVLQSDGHEPRQVFLAHRGRDTVTPAARAFVQAVAASVGRR